MFKQPEIIKKQSNQPNSIIKKLGEITIEQQIEFAKITGRFDATFKIGKTALKIAKTTS